MSDELARHRMHVVWGFLAAPLAGAGALGILSAWLPGDNSSAAAAMAIGGAIVGYLIAFALGIPAYLVLRKRVKPRLVYPTLGGAIIASAPFVVGELAFGVNRASLVGLFEIVRLAFPAGAVGGLAFWLIAVKSDANANRFFGPPREQPADVFD